MKILQVGAGDFFSTFGGGQVYVKNMVDELINHEAGISVLSFTTGDHVRDFVHKDYKSIDMYELYNPSDSVVEDVVREVSPDVIHAHSHKGQLCVVGKRLGIPVVVTAHHGGIVCPGGALMNCRDEICRERVEYGRCLPCVLRNVRSGRLWYPFVKHIPHYKYSALGKWLHGKPFIPFITPIGYGATTIDAKAREWRMIAENASLVIAPCRELGDALVRNGLDAERLRIVTHGIPMPERVPAPCCDKETFDFFFVGRICYVKGLHVLIKAFKEVKNTSARLHLIGGAGNNAERRYEARLRRMSAIDSRIVWHGKVKPEEVFEMTASYDVALSPSVCMEAFGLNIAEALALGKPVLAVRNGGAEMQIEEGVNGWLVEPNDVVALRGKMEELAALRSRLDAAAIAATVKPISRHAAELTAIYRQLLKDRLAWG